MLDSIAEGRIRLTGEFDGYLPVHPATGQFLDWTSASRPHWGRVITQRSVVIKAGMPGEAGFKAIKIYSSNMFPLPRTYSFIEKELPPELYGYFCRAKFCSAGARMVGADQDRAMDVVLMDWEDDRLDSYVSRNRDRVAGRQKLVRLARSFREMTAELNRRGIAHGDLCAQNICVRSIGVAPSPVLIDHDSVGWSGHHEMLGKTPGHQAFQLPVRIHSPQSFANACETVDLPSQIIIYLSLLAYAAFDRSLLEDPPEDGSELALTVQDLTMPHQSELFAWCLDPSMLDICPLLHQLADYLRALLMDTASGLPPSWMRKTDAERIPVRSIEELVPSVGLADSEQRLIDYLTLQGPLL